MNGKLTPIRGFEGLYSFTEAAQVYSHKGNRFMSQRLRPDGYVAVSLYRNGKQKQYFLHRLLAQTYIPNPNNYPEVNHIDENKSNNDITNLEWCTHKYNSNYGTRLQRMATTNSVPVIQYDKSGNEIARYKSQKEAAEATGVGNRHISCVCKGKRKTAGGYIWKYGQ